MESKQLYEAGKKDKYCAVCVKTFYSAEKLRQHIEAIHEGLKHKCPHCHEEFSYKNKLNKHIRNRHPEIQSQPNIKSETDCLTSKDESELKYENNGENIKNETVSSKHP